MRIEDGHWEMNISYRANQMGATITRIAIFSKENNFHEPVLKVTKAWLYIEGLPLRSGS
jgi:hypothetical protein